MFNSVFCRGQTPLHMLGDHAKDNAAVIFETMIECAPSLNVNVQDAEGNTCENVGLIYDDEMME